ncbi:AbrB/MazE/SpoVT family DNA-binding domain-containing protein [Limnofasciculus baicalensis]|uniref:AbrB/MazE/SpoVT family DNA-binding domain-containing protein n=1 Tax=Limnofasciculus baicalensis BBK-W-15 TaxID=2699891 RepID=A0AAE3GNM0_9CYAN|nr:AbrB/MazE/SpoVT family DNA-binding domain-containing protein [Limnofasciculus baicalensis]MCP2727699.1 AbrB/MazE/SpoVT family DNA-binding domain-containing protein [Limnofasciculus baicalensis BBK-W-15]
MTAIITKWGNSFAIRIPNSLAEQLQLSEGVSVSISVSDGNLIIAPQRRKKYTLDELLTGMTAEHFHGETDTGMPVGREVW